MPQNKRQIKLTIILISQFFLISLAKTDALQKPEDKRININSASAEELTSILQISEPLA